MAPVEFEDYSIRVKDSMNEALIAALHEAAGEVENMTIDNSRQGHKYGDKYATQLWTNKVDKARKEAFVGSPEEASYWEEFGTGEHALYGNGRKGWWVYIEGQDSGKGGKSYATKEEADETVAFLRSQGLKAYSTNGLEPNRPLYRAFKGCKGIVRAIFEAKLKGLG